MATELQHQHFADRQAFRMMAGVLAVVVAAAMVMVFSVLVAQIVQNLLGVTVTPAGRKNDVLVGGDEQRLAAVTLCQGVSGRQPSSIQSR